MIKSQKTRVGDFIIAFIIFLTMMICLLPMVNVLASSLSSSEHLIRNDVFLWPKGWNFEAYKTILSDSKYTWSLAWTGILTVVCTVLSLVLTVCTAFPLIYKICAAARSSTSSSCSRCTSAPARFRATSC